MGNSIEVVEPEPIPPSLLQTWKHAINLTFSAIIPTAKRIGRFYLTFTKKYGAIIAINFALLAASRDPTFAPTSVFRVLMVASVGYTFRSFSPILLPLAYVLPFVNIESRVPPSPKRITPKQDSYVVRVYNY